MTNKNDDIDAMLAEAWDAGTSALFMRNSPGGSALRSAVESFTDEAEDNRQTALKEKALKKSLRRFQMYSWKI